MSCQNYESFYQHLLRERTDEGAFYRLMVMSQRKILIIDDELGASNSIHQRSFLRRHKGLSYAFIFEACDSEGSGVECALSVLSRHPDVELILLDIKFGSEHDRLGYDILPRLTSHFPAIPVLIMSSLERDVQALARCLEDGATGFIKKGLDSASLGQAIERAIAMARSHVLLGNSPPLRELRRQAARMSPYDNIPVLIVGKRGTGKERVARHIH
ncbi:MAG: response regulator, partial [Desulfobacteraceae bacterium]|nr:response regulator [Desulfobacteraceae bacterium]